MFYDKDGNGYIAQMNLTRTIDVSGNISISGTIFNGDDVLQNIGYGWSFKFQDEKYIISYTKLNDEDNTVEFDAVHKFLWDFSKSVFYESWTGSHTFEAYLSALFSGSGYTYDLQTTVAAFEKDNWGMKNKADLLSDIISDAGVELEISNLKVTIKAQIGSDLTSIARYGINLSDLIEENNISNFATHGKGFGAYYDEDDTSKGRLEVEYTSDLAETYGILDLDPIVDERYTISANLLAAVKTGVDATFAVSVSLNMYDLENAGYPNYDSPQVGDWILAIDEKLNFKRKVRIIKLEEEFDANEKRIGYTVTAGDLSQAEQLQSAQVSATNAIQQLQQDVITVYYSANGKNRTFTGTDDPNTLGLTDLISGDLYWRTNGDKKELWIYDGTRWNQEVSDATGVEISENIATAMADADTAKQNANTAVETANTAISKAQIAIDSADDTADQLTNVSAVANQAKVDSATSLSNSATAMSNATTALSTADSALSKSTANSSSITTINTSIDDINGTLSTKANQTDLDKLTGRVTTSETNITQNAKDIALKANTSDVNTLTSRVSTAESAITVNANAIALKANTTDVNTLTGRVSTAESAITVNANAINTKVSSSDVQNMLTSGGYATQTWTTTQINTTASGINATISNVQTQVTNSAVGTNLLLNTSDYSDNWIWSVYPTIDKSQTPNILHYPSTTVSGSQTSDIVQQSIGTILQSSTTYTASFYAKGTGSFTFYCYANESIK
ncbi:reticulocyte binding protein [Liquorilactobacillus mali KCTC 3596 = DSM 20444]|uniref:Reticulocyte binding protein n=1 Tax=Liquorilactobacillus mali KCTC 3596 = DSM 20444 TaxID=1046596 RepID=A0A0R2DYN0_9LACO|nr:reticulocyte binding protein [Liquorilactobacillus mali KCTC 3596 = DSM 20444]